MLNHTAERIVEHQAEVIDQMTSGDAPLNVTLKCKWGFDGTSGQSVYRQRLGQTTMPDANLLSTTLVPLQMVSGTHIIWQNPVPSSVRFCRPLKLEYVKETPEKSRTEASYWLDQIDHLTNHHARTRNGSRVIVKHELQMSMVDNKVVNALTETSSQVCQLCGVPPSAANDLAKVREREVSQEGLKYGLSTLHAWIRFFECVIHIGYKIHVERGIVRSSEDKAKVSERKKYVQSEFRTKMSLYVDEPRSGGQGSSNDGNTARRAFSDEALFAEITGVSQELIRRFRVILEALSSGFEIDTAKFHQFCSETADMYVSLYPWYPMPPSVHKILVHGHVVLQNMILPIGMMSEEAQESLNKYIRAYRLQHT